MKKFLGGDPPEELPAADRSQGEDPEAAEPAAPPAPGERFLPDIPTTRDRYAQMGAEGLFFQRLQNYHRYFEKWAYEARYSFPKLVWVYEMTLDLLNEAAGLDEDDAWYADILRRKAGMRRLNWCRLVRRELLRKFRSKQMFGRQAMPHDRFQLESGTVVFNP